MTTTGNVWPPLFMSDEQWSSFNVWMHGYCSVPATQWAKERMKEIERTKSAWDIESMRSKNKRYKEDK